MAFAAEAFGGSHGLGVGTAFSMSSTTSPMEVDDDHHTTKRTDDASKHLLHPTHLPPPPGDIPTTPHPTPSADSQHLTSSQPSSLPRQTDSTLAPSELPPPRPSPALYFVNTPPPSIQNPPPHKRPHPPSHPDFPSSSDNKFTHTDPHLHPTTPSSHLQTHQYHSTLRLAERWSRIYQPLTAETDLLSLFSLTNLRETSLAPPSTGLNNVAETRGTTTAKIVLGSQALKELAGKTAGQNIALGGFPKAAVPADPEGKTYLAYLKDLPGKLEVVRDTALKDAISIPRQGEPIPIRKFDEDTLMSAFSIRPGPIPGFDASVLGAERMMDLRDEPSSRPQPQTNGAVAIAAGTALAAAAIGNGMVVDAGAGSSTPQPLVKPTIKLRLDYKPEAGEPSSPNGDGEKKKKKKKRKHDGDGDGEDDGGKKKKKKKKHKGEDHSEHTIDIEAL